MQGEQGRGSPEAADRFGQRLAELKRNGCNVLVVGTDGLDAACERLLGESSAGPRYRLFVTTDARPSSAGAKLAGVQSGHYGDTAAVVNWEDKFEEVANDAGFKNEEDSVFRVRSVESDDLETLRSEIVETVEWFEAEAGDLSPAELRLCFDSMGPLAASERDVERFLGGLTETVEQVRGMGHYHLSAEYDSEMVADLESLFDAVIEVRRADERVEQRWHLTDPDMVTEWIEL